MPSEPTPSAGAVAAAKRRDRAGNLIAGMSGDAQQLERYAYNLADRVAELHEKLAAMERESTGIRADLATAQAVAIAHADGLRAIRKMLQEESPEIERAILWCSDSLSGYTAELLAATEARVRDEVEREDILLLCAMCRRSELEPERERVPFPKGEIT